MVIAKLLLAVPGIIANAKDNFNNTALFRATQKGYHEAVQHIIAVA